MAGIYGVVYPEESNQNGNIEFLPNLDKESIVKSHFDFGRVHLNHFGYKQGDEKVGCSGSGNIVFGYCGEIYEITFPEVEKKGERNYAAYLADCFESMNNDLWIRLNGTWTAFVWDRREQELTLVSGRLGTFALYYSQSDRLIEFSTSLLALAENGNNTKKLDLEGVLEFISLCRCLGEKTIMANVKVIDAGTAVQFRNTGEIKKHKYWLPDMEPDSSLISPEDAADRIGCIIDHVVEVSCEGYRRVGLAVSGGLDSRTLATRLAGKNALACVFGTEDCLETTGAKQVCERLNIDFSTCHYTPEEAGRNFSKYVEYNDGYTVTPEYFLVAKQLASSCNKVLIGLYGGQIRAGCGCPTDAEFEQENRVFQKRFDGQNISYLREREFPKALGGLFSRELFKAPYRNFRKEFEPISAPTLYDKFSYFNLIERQRRQNAVVLSAGRAFVNLNMPFADNDFIDFLFKIPAWMKSPKVDVYRKALITRHPDIAALPNALGSNYISEAEQKLSMFSLKKKIWNMLPYNIQSRIYTRMAYVPISPTPGIAYRTTLSEPLKKYMQILVDVGILKQSFVDETLGRHFQGVETRERLFHKLIPLGYVIDRYGLSV